MIGMISVCVGLALVIATTQAWRLQYSPVNENNENTIQSLSHRQIRPSKQQEIYQRFYHVLYDLNGLRAGDNVNKRQKSEKKNSSAKLAARIHCYFSPVSCGVGRG